MIELIIVVAIIAIIVAIAIPNLFRARMNANQAAAVSACRAFTEAEEIYRRTDYDGDGVLEYSQTIAGNNSLVERTSGMHDLGLLDTTFGRAEGSAETATGKAGYVFTVLLRQGSAATGGVQNYIIGGNMTNGYGLSAVPSSYDVTGRNAYIINNDGVTFQKDVNGNLHQTIFNPDSTWTMTE
ncbi:MAG: DUF2950 family protein [Planctomycetota bacterium]